MLCIVSMVLFFTCYKNKKQQANVKMINNNITTLMRIDSQTQSQCNQVPTGNESDAIKMWLRDTVQLPQYYDIFIENGFDTMDNILCISDRNVLKDIGVNKIGHQMKIISDIKKLSEQHSNISTPKHNTVGSGGGTLK